MTLTCEHCHQILDVPDDPVLDANREARTQARIWVALCRHFAQHHTALEQQLTNPAGELLMWQHMIQCTSTDPRLKQWAEALREQLHALTEPAASTPKLITEK